MASGQEFSITIPPPEVITEILYRLPAKSVGRFRCVSKGWLSLLTDPQFIKTHKNNTLNNQHHLIFKTQRSISEGSLFLHSYPFHYREVVTTPTKFNLQLNYNAYGVGPLHIYGSCDGLVLVRVIHDFGETPVVINPTTRECLQLPEDYCNLDDTNNNNNECIQNGIMYGFGYDSVTDDYKVVSLTYYLYLTDEVDVVYVYVYSLRNKTWKRVTDSPYCYSRSLSVFVNGFINWIVSNDDDLAVIAAFSLADECFSEVPFPKFCNVTNTSKSYDCQLLVLGGKLAIFIKSEGEVWLMNEYRVRESWTKILLHGIDKVPIYKSKPYIKPLAFDHNGKILVANGDRMMVYEVEKAIFTETVCVWNPEMFSIAGFYVESLVSPKLGKEEEEEDDVDAEDENEEDDYAEVENEEDESEDDDAEDESEDDAEDENEEDDEDTSEGIRADLEFSGEKNIHSERQTSKRKDIDSSNAPFESYDSWKAKHRQEKLRADRLEGELTHALSKQQFLTLRLEENEATLQSKLVEIQAFKRRTREQGRALDTSNDEIESLKARLALADEERRKAIAALPW